MDKGSTTRRKFLTAAAAVTTSWLAGCRSEQEYVLDTERLASFKTLGPGETIPTFIMCPPKLDDDPRKKRELSGQWNSLKQAIEGLGGRVIAPDDEQPDASYGDVWTRDPALVFPKEKLFITGNYPAPHDIHDNPRNLNREAEQLSHMLERQGFRKIKVDHDLADGGDVIIDSDRKLVFVGCDKPDGSDASDTVSVISNATGYEVVLVPRGRSENYLARDHYFYHLDTGMTKLPVGDYLISESLTDPDTLAALKSRLGDHLIIAEDWLHRKCEFDQHTMKYADAEQKRRIHMGENAYHMAYNLIAVGKTLIMPFCSAELEKQLEERGLKVVTPEKLGLPEGSWQFRNGAVHCATQQIARNVIQPAYQAISNRHPGLG